MLQCMSKVNLTRFSNELLPVHSPLLRQSQLISFPLLINMLKFSKYSNLTSACNWKIGFIYTHPLSLYLINNMDMIKISHVMTIDTNNLCIVYNFVLYVYFVFNQSMLDMYCKLNGYTIELASNSFK